MYIHIYGFFIRNLLFHTIRKRKKNFYKIKIKLEKYYCKITKIYFQDITHKKYSLTCFIMYQYIQVK